MEPVASSDRGIPAEISKVLEQSHQAGNLSLWKGAFSSLKVLLKSVYQTVGTINVTWSALNELSLAESLNY